MPEHVLKDYALTTVDNLADALGVPSVARDHRLIPVIDAASDWIEGQTDRKLKARNYKGFDQTVGTGLFEHKVTGTGDTVATEDFIFFDGEDIELDGHGRGRFYLPQFPILTVDPTTSTIRGRIRHPNALTFVMEKLTDRTASGGETFETLVELDDYILDQERGIVLLIGEGVRRGLRNYRFTYTGGYSIQEDQPYGPDDLESLCIHIASKLYQDNIDVKAERVGSLSKSFLELSEDKYVNSIVMRYRRLEPVS